MAPGRCRRRRMDVHLMMLNLGTVIAVLGLRVRPSSPEVVHQGKLNESGEDEGRADAHPDVERLDEDKKKLVDEI